ncbi:MAG: DUF2304 domain-containing protein [Dissulfurispiraceae bacterium]
MDIVQVVAITVSVSIFFAVIELIRRSHLKERYSLIWLAASIVLISFSVSRNLLSLISNMIGIYYPPSFLFLLAIVFLLVLLLHFSTIISLLDVKNNRLAQELGLLQTKLKTLEKKIGTEDRTTPSKTGR